MVVGIVSLSMAHSRGLSLSPTSKEGLFSDYQVSNSSKLLSTNLCCFSFFLGQDYFFMVFISYLYRGGKEWL